MGTWFEPCCLTCGDTIPLGTSLPWFGSLRNGLFVSIAPGSQAKAPRVQLLSRTPFPYPTASRPSGHPTASRSEPPCVPGRTRAPPPAAPPLPGAGPMWQAGPHAVPGEALPQTASGRPGRPHPAGYLRASPGPGPSPVPVPRPRCSCSSRPAGGGALVPEREGVERGEAAPRRRRLLPGLRWGYYACASCQRLGGRGLRRLRGRTLRMRAAGWPRR